MADLDRIALSLPEVQTGVACAGTSLESRTFTIGGKTFLFVSSKDARLKLDASTEDARKRGFVVGANLWVTLPIASLPPERVLTKWVAESYGAVASKPAKASGKKPARKQR